MTTTDYLTNIAFLLIVARQARERELDHRSIVAPLAILFFVGQMYLHSIPTAGNDLVLIGALASLTRRERAVTVMRYYFDLPEASVADELQISVGTVKSTSARALAKLRISADPLAGFLAHPPALIPPGAASAGVQAAAKGMDQS